MGLLPKPRLVPPTPSMGMCPCRRGVLDAGHASLRSGSDVHRGGIALSSPCKANISLSPPWLSG